MDFNFQDIDAQEERRASELEAKEADMKQHANKLFQGFEDMNESYAKRALWELFQNAIDLVEKECEIIIELKEDAILFSHNGKHFTSKTLIYLIKQTSSKSNENNDNSVGQYGTGFITTHSFGRKFYISGAIVQKGYAIQLDDFEIDRTGGVPKLMKQLAEQEMRVHDLVGDRTKYVSQEPQMTTFKYKTTSEIEKYNAKEAIKYLEILVPFVMTFSTKLHKVTIKKYSNTKVYKKGDLQNNQHYRVQNIIQENDLVLKFLFSEENGLKVILPINSTNTAYSFGDNITKLFLYYPLIGSEKFGFNYVIHSHFFAPKEKRDSIHLNSNNETLVSKEKNNRQLIEKAAQMIFAYLKNELINIKDPIHLAKISCNTYTNDEREQILENEDKLDESQQLKMYFYDLKQLWINNLIGLPFVDTQNGRIAIDETYFLGNELLKDDEYFDSIYLLVNKYYQNIPNKNIAKEWTNTISNWDDLRIKYITLEMLLEKIQNSERLSDFEDKNLLKHFYQYVIVIGKKEAFEKFMLLPNIEDDFTEYDELKHIHNIHRTHIEIATKIIPTIPTTFLNNEFIFEEVSISKYYRKDLSKEFNTKILSYEEMNLSKEENFELIKPLIELCSIFSIENSENRRKEIVQHICKFYDIEFKEQIISNIEEDKFDFLTPIKGLIRTVFRDFVKKEEEDVSYVTDNIEYLKVIIELVYTYHDYKKIINNYSIIPNQNFKLKLATELSRESKSDFPNDKADNEYLKDTYYEVLRKDIRDELLLDDFNQIDGIENLIPKEEKGNSLCSHVESEFSKNGDFDNISEHNNRKKIIEIIEKITNNKEWGDYFPILDNKKAIILMSKMTGDELKKDLFKIISSDDETIGLLGELATVKNLKKLVEEGKKVLEKEKKDNTNLAHIRKIGLHIENLIRERVKEDLMSFEVHTREEQGGQDIILRKNGQDIFYVEVKSRWDKDNSIRMSALQMERSVKEKDKYALCSVNMTEYEEEDKFEVRDISIIIDKVQFVEDIGFRVKPLIDNQLAITDKKSEVSLTGDYQASVPQKIVNQGCDFNTFIDNLITKLNLKTDGI
jgi:hypothetical protein